jgi:hypothetical protein
LWPVKIPQMQATNMIAALELLFWIQHHLQYRIQWESNLTICNSRKIRLGNNDTVEDL